MGWINKSTCACLLHCMRQPQYTLLFLSTLWQFSALPSNYQLSFNLIKSLDSFPDLNYNLLLSFCECQKPLAHASDSGTSKLVQVLLGKSLPAALPDAGLIALISFLTIAFLISLCERILNSHHGSFLTIYWPFRILIWIFFHNSSWSLNKRYKNPEGKKHLLTVFFF